MSGIGDPFRKLKPGEPFVPVAAQFNMFIEDAQARRTQGQRVDSASVISQAASLPVTIRNDLAVDLPAFSVIRWQGGPVKSATINSNVPELQLKTAAYNATTKPIGVVGPQKIRKASGGSSAGSGPVSILGVTWARCVGPIADGDTIEPNSSYLGIKSSAGTPVIARGALSSGVQGIIPVFIGAGGGSCQKKYQLFVFWAPSSGSFSLPLFAQEKDPETEERSGTYYSETITIPYNATVTQTKTALESHSKIDSGEITVSGSLNLLSGPHTIILPAGVKFGDGDGSINSSGLTRSGLVIPYAYLSECCS